MSNFLFIYILLGMVSVAGLFLVVYGLIQKPQKEALPGCELSEIELGESTEPTGDAGKILEPAESGEGPGFSHKSPLVAGKNVPEVVQSQYEKEIESAAARPSGLARLKRLFRGSGGRKIMDGLE